MQFSSFLLVAVFAVSIARCAPALDAKTLAANANEAQRLNAKFLTLTTTDPCQGDMIFFPIFFFGNADDFHQGQETVCINGDIATCSDGKFDTSNGACPRTQECFAIPDIRAPGTVSRNIRS